MRQPWRPVLGLLVVVHTAAPAGEIPGLPSSLPPYLEPSLELAFVNDFLGRGGFTDDFRTQQIVITARPAERWTVLLDHSILTLNDPANPGRTDQLSGTVGYDLVDRKAADRDLRISVGAGVRSAGEFAGERMQNGAHRLVNSGLEYLPYTGISRTDVTGWFDANYHAVFREAGGPGFMGDWRFGAWGRVNSLVTGNGQWDGSAALYALANRRSIDVWLGLRRDRRSGYDAPVLRETAAAEDDIAAVIGVRFGSLILETVQQFNNEASYGQLRIVSSGARRGSVASRRPRIGIEAGLTVPDIQLHIAGRMRTSLLTSAASAWRESAYVSVDAGEPQHRDSNDVFIRSLQLGFGLEWERILCADGWLAAYGSIGAGWRDEKLVGDGPMTGAGSSSVGRAVLLGGAGIRAAASRLGTRWNYRLQMGLSAWLPASDASLQFGGSSWPVQRPALNLILGVTFDFE